MKNIKISKNSIKITVFILLLSSCTTMKKPKSPRSGGRVELAAIHKLELVADTLTAPFELGLFESMLDGKEEINLDDLYASFENIPVADLPTFSPEQTQMQVMTMSSDVKVAYNDEVQEYINRLTSRKGRQYMSKILALSQLYFPLIEKVLQEEGVPIDMKYSAVIESALIPNIVSRAGAVGLWQFMYFTGKQFDLEINSTVDQRCGIIESTRASAKYMKELYAMYGDWLMVLAAYNSGPGNVNKAIKRSGGKTDFWSVYQYLPKETRRHIPKFIATFYAFHYHTDLMIAPMRNMVTYKDVKVVEVEKPIHLAQVAEVLNVEEKKLAELNRNYLKGYIPAKQKSYTLVLPSEVAVFFDYYQDSIYSHNREKYYAANGKQIAKRKSFYSAYGVPGNGHRISYRVRSGDVLGRIANRFGTSVRKIKAWNGLRSDKIRIGQRLYIYTNRSTAQKLAAKPTKINKRKANIKLPYEPERYVYHTVKKNENPWTIAQQYEGITESNILEINKITNPRGIRVGQKLRIKKKS